MLKRRHGWRRRRTRAGRAFSQDVVGTGLLVPMLRCRIGMKDRPALIALPAATGPQQQGTGIALGDRVGEGMAEA
jgi:hypothetical protein